MQSAVENKKRSFKRRMKEKSVKEIEKLNKASFQRSKYILIEIKYK
jgi:hypothetical protein